MKMDAVFSPCGRYRYVLWRTWDDSKPHAMMILLNPSIADSERDSKTSKRCIEFAKSWGYGGLCIGNLFAYRSQNKAMIKKVQDPIGPNNDAWLLKLSEAAAVVVAGWGNEGYYMNRARHVSSLVKNLSCLRITENGQPQHPLYLPKGLKPIPFVSFYSAFHSIFGSKIEYLHTGDRMNFEKIWQYLIEKQPLSLTTFNGETTFKAYVSDTSTRYESSNDQRTQSKDNFRIYFGKWVKNGFQDRSLYFNLTGKKSGSARSRYFLAVFQYLEKIPELQDLE
jgi:hypothetical protein